MLATLLGIVTLVRLVQLRTPLPMLVTLLGMVKLANWCSPERSVPDAGHAVGDGKLARLVRSPRTQNPQMLVTPSGMVALARLAAWNTPPR
jgi:hypothetical protein